MGYFIVTYLPGGFKRTIISLKTLCIKINKIMISKYRMNQFVINVHMNQNNHPRQEIVYMR